LGWSQRARPSAAIAAYLARGLNMKHSIKMAKDYVTEAIQGSYFAGTQMVLGSKN
jgi:hydroxymethylpyrimidine/phosphomethylpyrimidine kinase